MTGQSTLIVWPTTTFFTNSAAHMSPCLGTARKQKVGRGECVLSAAAAASESNDTRLPFTYFCRARGNWSSNAAAETEHARCFLVRLLEKAASQSERQRETFCTLQLRPPQPKAGRAQVWKTGWGRRFQARSDAFFFLYSSSDHIQSNRIFLFALDLFSGLITAWL